MINQIVKSETIMEEKHNIIKKCLLVLKIMIEESEKKGTARVKSHSGLLKRKILKFNVSSSTKKAENCTVKLYGNTTMWDLKEIVAKKSKVCVDFLKLQIGKRELINTDHGRTVIDMNMKEDEEIKLSLNTLDSIIPRAELCVKGEVVPEVVEIFKKWFGIYSADGKMSPEHCANFTRDVTEHATNVMVSDSRVTGLFSKYDSARKGYLAEEDFVTFYKEAATNKAGIVWDNLKAMGVRNDLKMVKIAY